MKYTIMKQYTLVIITSIFVVITSHAEEVEISGTYQRMVACHDTHHVEMDLVVVAGKDKFSGVRHMVKISQEMRKQLRIGMKIQLRGERKPATKKQITKRKLREYMLKHFKRQEAIPYGHRDMSEIITKVKIVKDAKKARKKVRREEADAHDHGAFKLVPVADDSDVVVVDVPEYISVSKVTILEGDQGK